MGQDALHTYACILSAVYGTRQLAQDMTHLLPGFDETVIEVKATTDEPQSVGGD